MKDQIDELTLLLLYLTSFKDDYGMAEAQRSWKGYPFESLNELAENRLIVAGGQNLSISQMKESRKLRD